MNENTLANTIERIVQSDHFVSICIDNSETKMNNLKAFKVEGFLSVDGSAFDYPAWIAMAAQLIKVISKQLEIQEAGSPKAQPEIVYRHMVMAVLNEFVLKEQNEPAAIQPAICSSRHNL